MISRLRSTSSTPFKSFNSTSCTSPRSTLLASRCERVVRLLDGRIVDDVSVPRRDDGEELLERIGRIDP